MKKKYDAIGIMSGTSLDGVDIAYCSFQEGKKWDFELIKAKTYEFPSHLINKLKKSIHLSAIELIQLDHDLGSWIGDKTYEFIAKEKIHPTLVASHGHTIFHQPENGITYQMGNLFEIYKKVKLPVVGDFRSLDVTLGGQGAPLVPFGDELLFSDFDFCLNLGGFSNISFDQNNQRIAFDICPVNTVLNHLASKKGLSYDQDGELGSKGILIEELYRQLNELEYYRWPTPKSLGIEWVNEHIFPLFDKYPSSIEDQLFTFYKHVAFQINQAIQPHLNRSGKLKLLITGGGAFNNFLIKNIHEHLDKKVECIIPDHEIISYKEAIVFAFLGLLRWLNKVNTLKSVTGSAFDSSGGVIINNLITKVNNNDIHQ